MRAMIIRGFGPPSVLEAAELPVPEPAAGQLLVKVAASALNPIDAKIRARGMGLAPELPGVLHGDFSGEVVEAGRGAARFKAGDEVFGLAATRRGPGGALAEFLVVDERLVARKPPSLGFAEAAALPVAGLAAREALLERGRLAPGMRLLVLGGAGAVGNLALQIARAAGVDAVSTASARHLGLLGSSGARLALDRERPDLEAALREASGGEGYDLVLDCVGGPSLDLAFALAAPGGAVSAIAARSTHDLSPLHAKGLSLHVVFVLLPALRGAGLEKIGMVLAELAGLAEAGALLPRLHPRRFALAEAGEAHELWESGRAEGKILIEPGIAG